MTEYPVTFPADGPISLRIKQRAGNVFVAATDTETIHVDVRPADDRSASHDLVTQTRVDHAPGSLSIDVPRSGGIGIGGAAVNLVLTVPTGTVASIESGSGDIQLRGGFGDVSATTGSGDIVAERLADAKFSAGSGDIRIGEAVEARVKTGSGDVRVDHVHDRLSVDTASGAADVRQAAPTTSITVASGDITVGETSGLLELKSASGDIAVRRAVEGDLRVRTASGDLVVGIATGTAAKLDCSSISGRVVSELDSADAPGDGDRQLLVTSQTASGSVILRRA